MSAPILRGVATDSSRAQLTLQGGVIANRSHHR